MKHTIKRRRLAMTRWTSHKDHSVRLLYFLKQNTCCVFRKTKIFEREWSCGAFQDTHFNFFTMENRHNIHTHVDIRSVFHLETEAAVLRNAMLVDLQVAEDLHACNKNRSNSLRQTQDLGHDTVDAKTNKKLTLEWFKVNV